jgi:neurotransmitter:Na+ symporter, NSS family
MAQASIHGMWSSRMTFVLAASGSAVGLGNIWRFPYLASDNGGGAFVLIYLACIALVGLPIMLADVAIGRRGRLSPINSVARLAADARASRAWRTIGYVGTAAALLVLSFYSVVAGWTLHYAWLYVSQLGGAPGISDPAATFAGFLQSPGWLLLWHTVFMLLTYGVVALGVEKGLERAVRVLMPALVILLLTLFAYGVTTGGLGQAFAFLFVPDFTKVTGATVLAALGQAFFSLSLGNGLLMAYGAYLPQDVSIPRVSVTVAIADTGIALLAGLAIFPIVIAFGLDPAGGGSGLIFTALPHAFGDMTGGVPYAIAFFLLLAVAAWTSSISMLEPPTAFLVEWRRMSRGRAAAIVALGVWLMGLVTVLSFNVWSGVRVMNRDLQGMLEYVSSDLMLPSVGLLTALFAGWILDRRIMRDELRDAPDWLFTTWRWVLRVVSPLLVLLILLNIIL